MKQLVKPAAIIVAAIVTAFAQPSFAAGKHSLPYHKTFTVSASDKEAFSLEVNQPTNEVIRVTIKNSGKKRLSVTLNGPDGFPIDNFFAGKKINQVEKAYNFSGAESGIYTIEVSDGSQKIRKQIKLERVIVTPLKLTVQ
ncbi:MAG: hypothetical protein ABJB86_10600 [Bacteroidota bacterium]